MGAILIFAFNVIFVSVFVKLSLPANSYLILPFFAPSVFKRARFFAQRLCLLDHYEDDLLKLTLQDRGN